MEETREYVLSQLAWFASRIVRRVSPEMYESAQKTALPGNNHDVGTRSTPRVARLSTDPTIPVSLDMHTSVSKSLSMLCEKDWVLVYDQLAVELRLRAKVHSSRLKIPPVDDFDADEALLYLPFWRHVSNSPKRPRLEEFETAGVFLESLLAAYYDFEDLAKMLTETGGALDSYIQGERENRARSPHVPIRELSRISFCTGVLLDCKNVNAFVWALYALIHRAAVGQHHDLLGEIVDMVVSVALHEGRGPSWNSFRSVSWFEDVVVRPAKMALERFTDA